MKVNISKYTYIFLLLSFLSGYFEYIYLYLLIIFIHESGHYFFSRVVNFKFKEIIIYPFGGITSYEEDLNISVNKEIITLLGGIIFQVLFLLLCMFLYKSGLILERIYLIIVRINKLLIGFNFMPVLPLDGGKLINLILDKLFSYKLSNIISIIISIITIIYFILNNKTYFGLILFLFLVKSIIIEINLINIKYYKFLLERYNKKYNFNKIKIINSINKFKRDNYHIINNMFERDYLNKLFDRYE